MWLLWLTMSIAAASKNRHISCQIMCRKNEFFQLIEIIQHISQMIYQRIE